MFESNQVYFQPQPPISFYQTDMMNNHVIAMTLTNLPVSCSWVEMHYSHITVPNSCSASLCVLWTLIDFLKTIPLMWSNAMTNYKCPLIKTPSNIYTLIVTGDGVHVQYRWSQVVTMVIRCVRLDYSFISKDLSSTSIKHTKNLKILQ